MASERSRLLDNHVAEKFNTFSDSSSSFTDIPIVAKLESPDDTLSLAGHPGRFHYFQLLALCIQFVPLVMSDLIPIFYNLPPQQIYCNRGENANETAGRHLPANFAQNADQVKGGNKTLDYCNCNGTLEFIYYGEQTSVIGDMRLVCEQSALPDLATTLYYVGSAIAGPICGWLSDHYGRRPVLLISSIAFIGVHTSLIFVRNFILFTTLRFFAGMGRVGVFSTAYVLVMEWTLPSRRTVVAAASEFFFPAGVILLAACARVLQKWTYIQIFLASCTGVAVLNFWFAPESLQWLLVNRKVRQATDTLKTICRVNSRSFTDDAETALHRVSQKSLDHLATARRYTVLDCFKIRKIRRFTLLISFIWFSTNFGYSGLSFLIDNLSDNIYVDLMIGGALELIPCLLATLIALRSGKKYPMMTFFIVAGALTVSAGLVHAQRLKVALALLGRMSLVGSYCLMFLYAAELFPTEIRNSGFGVGFFFFMAGGMLAPQLSLLTLVVFPGLPLMIIGVTSVMAALAVFILPENTDPAVLHTD